VRVGFDRDTRIGMFNRVAEWGTFVEDADAGKATLVESEEVESDLCVRDVPEREEFEAQTAARVCPVDAITINDGDDQIVP